MRRAFASAAGAALAGAVAMVASACAPAPAPRPPIVLFLIDTLRADHVGAYGHGQPTTPHLDALAAEGVVFERAIAPAPWTLPSVASILTSTWPCEHGVLVDGQQVRAELPTLAERLRPLGYRTVSLHANEYAGAVSGLDRGYELSRFVAHTDGGTIAPLLEQLGPAPFFLYVHNVEPHDGYVAPRALVAPFGRVGARERRRVNRLLLRYRQLTREDFAAGRPPGTTDNSRQQQRLLDELAGLRGAHRILYDGDVRLADARLGSVIDALRASGLWEETLFVALSDHGEEFGEHGGVQHDQSVYEELLHVPLIIRFPHGAHAGRRVSVPVSLLDVQATLLDWLGAADATIASGRSLLPRVRRTAAAEGAPVPALRDNRKKFFAPFERLRGDVNVAWRDGAWKAIWNAEPGRVELYDLAADPGETRDLAGAEPARARALGRAAEAWLASCRARGRLTGAGPRRRLDAQTRERLRALGYAE